MKFTLVKDLKKDALMRPLLTGLLLFLLLFLVSDVLNKKHQIGIGIDGVSSTLYGNEEEFLDPVSIEALLEIAHTDLFFIMMSLLSLSAVFGRLTPATRLNRGMIHAVNLTAFASVALLMIAYYSHPAIAVFWLAAMWGWHALAFWMAAASLYRLYR